MVASQVVSQRLGVGEHLIKVLSKPPIVPSKPVKVRTPKRPADKDNKQKQGLVSLYRPTSYYHVLVDVFIAEHLHIKKVLEGTPKYV